MKDAKICNRLEEKTQPSNFFREEIVSVKVNWLLIYSIPTSHLDSNFEISFFFKCKIFFILGFLRARREVILIKS